MCVVDLSPDRILRFWVKVAVGYDHECWLWLGSVDRKGYGHFRCAPRRTNKAHIFSYVLHNGSITAGMQVDHTCNTPGFQNPSHLRQLEGAANNARSTSPSAINARKTHCLRGHPFDDQNTIYRGDGTRRCKTCDIDQKRRAAKAVA